MLRLRSNFIKKFIPYSRTLCTTTEPIGEPTSSAADDLSSTIKNDEKSQNLPPPWENPWIYALGQPTPAPKYTEVVESKEEFKWVNRLKPFTQIPEVPNHSSFPTPSGWRPPKDPLPDLPYYVRRNRRHMFDLFLERRRDTIETTTMEYNYVELVVIPNINGDVFACEKDLQAYLQNKLGRVVGTHVNEPQGKIRVKGADRSLIEQFLWHCGF